MVNFQKSHRLSSKYNYLSFSEVHFSGYKSTRHPSICEDKREPKGKLMLLTWGKATAGRIWNIVLYYHQRRIQQAGTQLKHAFDLIERKSLIVRKGIPKECGGLQMTTTTSTFPWIYGPCKVTASPTIKRWRLAFLGDLVARLVKWNVAEMMVCQFCI